MPETETAPVAPDVELQPTETPAAPPESPAPAETPPAPAEGDDALSPETPASTEVPRDAQCRFTKSDGTLSEPGEAAPVAEPAEPDLGEYDPFTFRSDGQATTYPGAVQDDDGNVLFTPEAVQQLRQDLAFARAYPRRDSELNRELNRERTRAESAEATAKAILTKLDQMFEQSQNATTVEELLQTPLGQWIINRHAEWPKLRAEGLQQGFDRRSKALEEENRRLRESDQERQQRPMMLGRIEEAVETWGREAGFDAQTMRDLQEEFSTPEMLDLIFPRAAQDDPVTGRKAGQRYENLDVIRGRMQRVFRWRKSWTSGQSAASVAAENARRTGQDKTAPPPVGGGRSTVPVPSKGPAKKFKTTREADEDAGLL